MVDEFPEMQISSLKLQRSLQGLQAKTWLMLQHRTSYTAGPDVRCLPGHNEAKGFASAWFLVLKTGFCQEVYHKH